MNQSQTTYQVYFRDPQSRSFVPIDGLRVRTVYDNKTSSKIPILRNGIPLFSYLGTPRWWK